MKYIVRVEGQEKRIEIEERNGLYEVTVDGEKHLVDCKRFGHKDYLSLLINNKCYLIESASVDKDEGRYYANVMGRHYEVEVLDELLLAARKAGDSDSAKGSYTVLSPMPGLIIDIKVRPGENVSAGDPVVIMEAMKMQNSLITEVAGVVKDVRVKPKDTVDSQTPLVVIEIK